MTAKRTTGTQAMMKVIHGITFVKIEGCFVDIDTLVSTISHQRKQLKEL